MSPTAEKPTIAVTIGDPAGVGPEVVLKALTAPEVQGLANWMIVGDQGALAKSCAACGITLASLDAAICDLKMITTPEQIQFGKLSVLCGRAAVEYVRMATEMCLAGKAQGMVTAPLNKEAVAMSGMQFSGHTEYIADLCGATEFRMLLASPKLSVIHVTTHVPLRDAIESSTERILRTIELGDEAMRLLGFKHPRLAMCGLNPHAGEHGLFGYEDTLSITPAVEAARKKGILVDGPHAPDTIFLLSSRGGYDMVVAMYHDQGHIAMKLIDFENTVNVSFGIPIIRTSVDHGTAFDIAGLNKADPRNMIAALRMGASMAAGKMKKARSLR